MPLSFGSALQDARSTAKLSLRALASEVGVSAAYLSKIETGQWPPPADDKVLGLAKALRVDAAAWIHLAHQEKAQKGSRTRLAPATSVEQHLSGVGIRAALRAVETILREGVAHGFFEASIACETEGSGSRLVTIRAGRLYRFRVPAKEIASRRAGR
jgi:transcriptional regulator with XRE-family HTH domain